MDNNNNPQNTTPAESVTPNVANQASGIKIGAGKLTTISLIILIVSIALIGLAVWGILSSKTWQTKNDTISSVKDHYNDNNSSGFSSSTSSKKDYAMSVSENTTISNTEIRINETGFEFTGDSAKGWKFIKRSKQKYGICENATLTDWYCGLASIVKSDDDTGTVAFNIGVASEKEQILTQWHGYGIGKKIEVDGAIEAWEYNSAPDAGQNYISDYAVIFWLADHIYVFIAQEDKNALIFTDQSSLDEKASNKQKFLLSDIQKMISDIKAW